MADSETGRDLGIPPEEQSLRELYKVPQLHEISGAYDVVIEDVSGETTGETNGRAIVPAKFRQILGTEQDLKLSPWINDTLIVCTPSVFARLKEEAAEGPLSILPPDKLSFLFSIAPESISLDRQGRIPIPQGHRAFANLQHEAVAVGRGDYVEYWNPEKYAQSLAEIEDAVKDVMPRLHLLFAARHNTRRRIT